MKRLIAVAVVLAAIVACAGCSSSAPTPTPAPAPAPAQNEQRLGEEDLDGDGKADAVFAVPTSPVLTTYTSMHVVAGSGQPLLTLTNADGDFDGVFMASIPGAPAPVLVVYRVGPARDHLMTPYLYDKATKQMVALQWARRGQQTTVLEGKIEIDRDGNFMVLQHYDDGRSWQGGSWVYTDGKLTPAFEP